MVWFLHQDGGGGLGLSSGGCVSKSVSVAMRLIASATAMMLPPAAPIKNRYGIPKIYRYWIFIRWVSQYPETKG